MVVLLSALRETRALRLHRVLAFITGNALLHTLQDLHWRGLNNSGKSREAEKAAKSAVQQCGVCVSDPLLVCMGAHTHFPNVTCQGSRRELITYLLSRNSIFLSNLTQLHPDPTGLLAQMGCALNSVRRLNSV